MRPKFISLGLASLTLAILGLTASAQTATPTPSPTVTPKPKVDLVCMQNAVDKRDGAIITAFDTFHTSLSTALKDRQTALKNAWSLTDRKARREAIRSAWKNYRTAAQAARKALRIARRTAWQNFMKDRRGCGPQAWADDGANEAVDINL